ncbi:hypothetical protein ANO11243_041650 [Dothideomycetidae sp. 11243]|nr:hypothetical protein ANO11243_041650 [fungal sp. No.11243]
MKDRLRIRNCTSQDISLPKVDRYEPPPQSYAATFTRNVTSLVTSTKTSPAEHLFEPEPISVAISAFAAADTEIKPLGSGTNHVLRLTLALNGLEYLIALSPGTKPLATVTLVSKDKHNATKLAAIYLPSRSLLTLHFSPSPTKWMSHIPDSAPLSLLSIPGTHNSPCHRRALPSVRCHSVPISTQLRSGIRFLDVRVQPVSPPSDTLALVHGAFPVSLTGRTLFRPLLEDIQSFLSSHPSETILLSLKREGPGSATDAELSTIIQKHYISSFHPSTSVPTLGQARGKLLLLRRYGLAPEIPAQGIDATFWPHSQPHHENTTLSVQDYCDVFTPELIPLKSEHVCAHLARASKVVSNREGETAPPLCLNFLSASNFWRWACWPEGVARRVNPAALEYLCSEHGVNHDEDDGVGSTGIVVCDWVGEGGDWDLVNCVVGMNERLKSRWR